MDKEQIIDNLRKRIGQLDTASRYSKSHFEPIITDILNKIEELKKHVKEDLHSFIEGTIDLTNKEAERLSEVNYEDVYKKISNMIGTTITIVEK